MPAIISTVDKKKINADTRRRVDVDRFNKLISAWVDFLGPRPVRCPELVNYAMRENRNGNPAMAEVLRSIVPVSTRYPAHAIDQLLRKFIGRSVDIEGVKYTITYEDGYWCVAAPSEPSDDSGVDLSSIIGPDLISKLRRAGYSLVRTSDARTIAAAEDPQRALFRAWLDRFGAGSFVKAASVMEAASFDVPLSLAVERALPVGKCSPRSLGWYLTACVSKPIGVDGTWYVMEVRCKGSNGNLYGVVERCR